MTRTTRTIAVLALGAVLLAGAGCVRVELADRDDATDGTTKTVDLGAATRVDAAIQMGAGQLLVEGGADQLMDADFDYSHVSWEPRVVYTVEGEQGRLKVTQPDIDAPTLGGTNRNTWHLRLADDVPMDLTVELGAGEGDLRLGGLDLEDLTVKMGVGDTTVDLTGEPVRDLDANIEGGVGALTLRLPAGVGVRLVGFRDGLGNYSAPGFEMDGDSLVNDEWETAAIKYDIVLRRGIGDVTVQTVD